MQEHPNPIPETAIKPKAPPTKKSTPRTKSFRDNKAAVGLQRLDIYTSDKIKSEVREIAKKENITAGIAAESLLFLGIEAYLRGGLENDNVMTDDVSNQVAQSDAVTNLTGRLMSPRHRLELLIKHDDLRQSRRSESSTVLSPDPKLAQPDINSPKPLVNGAEGRLIPISELFKKRDPLFRKKFLELK